MPTPYGSRGGMAFSAEELRVLRRALGLALHPSPVRDEDVQDCLRLAESVDEAVREGARLRAFLVADLARYRAALPGTATGYLALLDDVLSGGYQPTADDLAALRALRGNPTAATLLDRCRVIAERAVRARLAGRAVPAAPNATPLPIPLPIPASRTRLLALPGGLDTGGAASTGGTGSTGSTGQVVCAAPNPRQPSERPATTPPRPVPTPAEVFPPKRRPETPAAPTAEPAAPATPADPPHQLVAG
ncbi:hypothetical protein [Streptomyces sp. NPDC020607]|uniref:hypothetical protein n=1 Tax=Streptomyces sp. NPDC020607 TaxID=3365082 RepID=UPI00379FA2D2